MKADLGTCKKLEMVPSTGCYSGKNEYECTHEDHKPALFHKSA